MTEAPATPQPPAETPGLSLMARFWGVLTSPRETFADVAARPRWFGMMALVLIVTAVCMGGFFSTEVGQTAWLDKAVESAQQSGRSVPESQMAVMEKMAAYMGPIYAASTLLVAPLMWLAVTGILFVVFNAALGGVVDLQAAVRGVRALDGHHGDSAGVRDAAELLQGDDVERHEPGGVPADARRGQLPGEAARDDRPVPRSGG